MAGVTGRTVKQAFVKIGAGSWGVAGSVTKGVYFRNDQGLVHQPDIVEDLSMGQAFIGTTERGNTLPVETTLSAQSRYADHLYIFDALLMGSPAAVAISTSASGQTTTWSHVIDLADDTSGLGLTFAEDLNLYVKEMTSAKVIGMVEEISPGSSAVEVSYTLLGSDATVSSSTNINSTVAGASFPSLGNRLLKKQGTFRMNLQSAGSLVAADAVRNIDGLRFEYTLPQDRSHELGNATMVIPESNEFPRASLQVVFNRATTASCNSLRAALPLGTIFKGDWTSTSGTLINSTEGASKKWQYPHLEVTNFEDTVEEGGTQLKPRVTFAIYKPSSAPTGMAGITQPFRLTRVMQNSINAFA
jgi:hypothetical protein